MRLRVSAARPIAVATGNADKFREIVFAWGPSPPPLRQALAMPVVDERFETYEENALLKARELATLTDAPALADDSGIEIEALGWKPGVRSARTPTPDASPEERNAHILGSLRGVAGAGRRARFVCACALVVPGFAPIVARGEAEGLIAASPSGSGGFGYDPIFFYPPLGMTFAQAGPERKNAMSHRGKAIRALRALLAPHIVMQSYAADALPPRSNA